MVIRSLLGVKIFAMTEVLEISAGYTVVVLIVAIFLQITRKTMGDIMVTRKLCYCKDDRAMRAI